MRSLRICTVIALAVATAATALSPANAENAGSLPHETLAAPDDQVVVSRVHHDTPEGREAVERVERDDAMRSISSSLIDAEPFVDEAPPAPATTVPLRSALSSDDPPPGGPPTLGNLRFTRNGVPHRCTASVINTATRNIVVTAAHCVYNKDYPSPVYSQNMTYTPMAEGNAAPLGVWHVTHHVIYRAWRERGSYAYDIALLNLAPQGGKNTQDVVGANGWRAKESPKQHSAMVLGYRDPASQGTLRFLWERGNARRAKPLGRRRAGMLACPSMGKGASGGPWLLAKGRQGGVGTTYAVLRGVYWHNNTKHCIAYPFRSSFKKLVRTAEKPK